MEPVRPSSRARPACSPAASSRRAVRCRPGRRARDRLASLVRRAFPPAARGAVPHRFPDSGGRPRDDV
ncbi:hypothetical protein BVI2075_630018 [Burkholderia vietnamiensis]|nr:hypothetical protein BVI2075_630018 [Burkholderia vietnamiensis]